MRILISRIDAIGDVVLTLPMAGLIQRTWPGSTVGFLCQSYTQDVVGCSEYVHEVYNWKELSKNGPQAAAQALRALNFDVIVHVFPNKQVAKAAKSAGIKKRVGTSRRFYHWLTCNVVANYSRKKSNLHESQLNCQLLIPLGLPQIPVLTEMPSLIGMKAEPWWPQEGKAANLKNDLRPKIILHMGSRGSARNWPLAHFLELAHLLQKQNVLVFLTGTEAEGRAFRNEFPLADLPNVLDVSGTMTLLQLMGFISNCQGLVAASTGPLHLAASLGIRSVGLYPPLRPMHAGRWGPVGKNVQVLRAPQECFSCPNVAHCACMNSIAPAEVVAALKATELGHAHGN